MDALGQILICRVPATGFWGAAGMWVVMMSATMLGGTMNLAWMVVLTLLVAAERMLRMRGAILHGSALALLGAGSALMLGAAL